MADIRSLRDRYVAMNGAHPAPSAALDAIEARLGIKLPADFREIGGFFDGSGLHVLPLFSLAGDAPTYNPVHHTLRLRTAIGLPPHMIVLAEPPESLVLMDSAAGGKVLWMDATDATNISTGSYDRPPDSWNTFAEFFEYLLDEEEDDRASRP